MATGISKRQGNSPMRSLGWAREPWFEEMLSHFLPGEDWASNQMAASMDVSETDQTIEVTMDLPGVSPEDVDIQVENGTLVVRGQRKEQFEEGDKRQFHRVERRIGKFARSIVLPTRINESEAAAEFKDGVLRIVLPKADEAKAHRISVKK